MKIYKNSKFPHIALSECGVVITGNTPSKTKMEYWGGDIPFISPTQLGKNTPITKSEEYVTQEGAEKGRLLECGTVLVCCIGSLGKIGVAGTTLITNQQINAIEFNSKKVKPRYGFHVARNLKPVLEHYAPSTTVKIIKKSTFEKIKIPLPPLAEQKRIAEILDATDALRTHRRQAIALLDDFLQATFLAYFGDNFSTKNYDSCSKQKISELVSYIDYRGKTPTKTDSGVPLITAKNVKHGYLNEEPREYISEELYEEWMTRGLPLKKDVLFTTEAPLGNVALLGEYDKVAIGQRLVSLRCKEMLCPEYLMFALLQPFMKHVINKRSSGSTVRGIRTKEFYQIEIPVPPPELQTQFAEIVESVETQKSQQQAHLAELDTLFACLQQRAFAGEL